jgi:hypothetical protein
VGRLARLVTALRSLKGYALLRDDVEYNYQLGHVTALSVNRTPNEPVALERLATELAYEDNGGWRTHAPEATSATARQLRRTWRSRFSIYDVAHSILYRKAT